ncbi:MAG: DUF5979 domain-containing protein [Acidimicrobiia bacterium]
MAIAGAIAMATAATFAIVAPAASGAETNDSRAVPHDGNATNCGSGKNGIGVGGTLAFANGTDGIDDGNVSGTVTDGKFVDVDTPSAGVVILAVVVKGGPGYNVYLPPYVPTNPETVDHPTDFVSPLVGADNIPTVSHWFICYTSETPPDTGSLAVSKSVLGATTLTSFTVHVECEGMAPVDLILANGDTEVITDIPDGTSCNVSETGTGVFPSLTQVTVGAGSPTIITGGLPTSVAGPPVEVVGGDQAEVTVVNDFTNVAPADVIRPAEPIAVAPAFTG